jgi:hypothetical protein
VAFENSFSSSTLLTMAKKSAESTEARVAALQAPVPLPDAVPVIATHLLLATPTLYAHDDCAEMVGVTPRTLDNWVDRGCPVAKRNGRNRLYDVAQVFTWSAAFAKLKRDHQERRIRHMPTDLGYLHAFNVVQMLEYDTLSGTLGADGVPFVCVPLAHDHPARAWALRLACAGQRPGPLLDAEEWLEGMPDVPTPTPSRSPRKRTP